MRTKPAFWGSRPATTRRRVVFPQPLGPRKQTNSPSPTESETLLRATTSPNFLAMPSSSTAGGWGTTLFRVPLLPLSQDSVAGLGGPLEVVGVNDLAYVLGQPLRDRKALDADGCEILRVQGHGLVADGPVQERFRGRDFFVLL